MAKAQAAAQKGAQKKSGGGFKTILLMALMGCVVPFGVPTLLVCIGLMPTIVVLFTDTDANRSGLATVGYMNLAGVLPFLVELWQKGQTMEAAVSIIRQPYTWVVMFGSAGVGQLILYAIPAMISSIVILNLESRLRTLQEGKKQLEAIWGADVGNTNDLDSVRRNKGA